tara:strand:+ start:2096 stop:2497 length:402 start_codon:yes stop_codon:yes gene_type:complete
MAVNWTNNFNDTLQGTDVITAGLSGDHIDNSTTVKLSSFELTDGDGVGHPNWVVGDSFYVTGSASTLYEITAITQSTGRTYATDTTGEESNITITPGFDQHLSAGNVIYKEGGYKGNQGSAKNHVRLRNQGLI